MKRLARHVALLALAGAMGVAAPAIAAPGGGGTMGGAGADNMPNCTGPAANSPACAPKGKPRTHHMKPGSGNSMGGNSMGGNQMMQPHHKPLPPGPKGPPGPPKGPMGANSGHMGPPPGFDAFRHSFRFPHFAPPPFSARPGFTIPHSYHHWLRPLPPQFFGYYPMYRGFLFFETPDGQIVIVDPRSFRIIAII